MRRDHSIVCVIKILVVCSVKFWTHIEGTMFKHYYKLRNWKLLSFKRLIKSYYNKILEIILNSAHMNFYPPHEKLIPSHVRFWDSISLHLQCASGLLLLAVSLSGFYFFELFVMHFALYDYMLLYSLYIRACLYISYIMKTIYEDYINYYIVYI